MRIKLLAAALMLGVSLPAPILPASAQTQSIDRRVGKLESEMRSVQRKVFPGGNIEPEIRPETMTPDPSGIPVGGAVDTLTARVDALESSLATLTGQAEENGFRLRQLEEQMKRLQAETDARLKTVETRPAPAPVETIPAQPTDELQAAAADPGPANAQVSAPDTGDAGEDAYLLGFRQWEARRFADAAKTLEAAAKKFPQHSRASYSANLAGRAYLDDGKPATAAKVLLANYQNNPKGERAADSLYFLGQSLIQLKRPAEACKVYDELQDVYGATMRDWLKQRLPRARTDAKCS